MKRDIVKVFKALGDSNRIRIVKMLEARELCVCEVREHLSVLRDADLILDRKDGKWVNYRLNEQSNNSFVRSQLVLVKN